MEVVAQIERVARYRPDDEFLVAEDGRRWTWGEFDEAVNLAANAFAAVGGGPGGTLGVLCSNTPEHLQAFFGGLRCGATVVPLNFRGGTEEIAHQLTHDGVETLVAGPTYAETVASIADEVGEVVETVVQQGSASLDAALDYDDLLAGALADRRRPPSRDADDVAILYHTGGTTGVPKTVPWRVGAVEGNAVRHGFELRLGPDDVGLVATPLFHIGSAIFGSFLVPYTEGRLVLLDRFDPEKTLAWIEREGVTHSLLVPSMMRAILGLDEATVAGYDRSSLEALAFTGENLDDRTKGAIRTVFPNACVYNVYGATEVGSTMALRPGTDRADSCIGVPFADREVTVRDDAGEVCDPGDPGELWVRGRGTPDGYYRIPEMTAERYRNGPEGDWFSTGDVGYVDEQGFFHYAGRLDDRITRGGENVYPAEVEGVVLSHEDVDEAVAFGVPHDVLGETVAVAVVRRAGSDLDADALRAFCRERLAGYKTPGVVRFRESLPRTDAGKFDREALADEHDEEGDT